MTARIQLIGKRSSTGPFVAPLKNQRVDLQDGAIIQMNMFRVRVLSGEAVIGGN